MKNITYADTALIIESIYESEIPFRIEAIYDGGFTWSIQDGSKYPRIFIDNNIDGLIKIISESSEHILLKNNPFIEKDWIARGNNSDYRLAIKELADKICELYPKCKLAEWYIFENRKEY